MKLSFIVVIVGIFFAGLTIGIFLNEKEKTNSSEIQEVITTFSEKYSEYGITEFPDSNGVPWKYTAETGNRDVELILGKDRVILRAYDKENGDATCTIVNPFPKDVLDNCPPKW